jgi:hypothetical protein
MTGCPNFTYLVVTSRIYLLTAREKMKKCLNFCNLPGKTLQAFFFFVKIYYDIRTFGSLPVSMTLLLSSVTLRMQKKLIFFIFFSYNLPAGTFSPVLKILLFAKIFICKDYFSPLNTFLREGKDPDPDSVPLTIGSGSGSRRPKNMRILVRATQLGRVQIYFFSFK